MYMAHFKFPDGFLWGAATSAHQVEGGTHNDWSEWEKANAARLACEAEEKFGNLPIWPDIKEEATKQANYISGKAADHYNRFREDFDIAKSLGHNAHRFSIEWSRIEPEEGKFDEKEIEHYRDVIKALRARGLEPFLTLWHWTLPLWVQNRGGIIAKDFPRYFQNYTRYIASTLPEVKFWMTLNEPTSVIANSYFVGVWPPGKRSLPGILKAYRNLAKAHVLAYRVIHELVPYAEVGFGNLMKDIEPRRKKSLDRISAWIADYWANERFFKLIGNTNDYVGLQYYFHDRVRFLYHVENENKEISDLGWELYPEGIYHVLKKVKKFGKPVYITENGLADANDTKRAKFIREHLIWVAKAISEGVDVCGYFHWSLLDNFEWDKGFWPRFGLVEVDYKTQERKIRPSAFEYKKIIESNSIDF